MPRLILNCDATTTPNDWVSVGTGDKVVAVTDIDHEQYIVSTGKNTEQWFTVEDAPVLISGDPDNDIRSFSILVHYKQALEVIDNGFPGKFELRFRITGSGDEIASPLAVNSLTCWRTDEFFSADLSPMTAKAFTWSEINDLRIGAISVDADDTAISLLQVIVDYGDVGWTVCPRCCCCCMCFSPTVNIGAWSLGAPVTGAGTLTISGHEITVPFNSIPGPTSQGCYWLKEYDAPDLLVAEGATIDVYLQALAIECGVTALPTCCTVTAVYYYTAAGDPTPLNTVIIVWIPELTCCDPHHLSIADVPYSVTLGGAGNVGCPSAEVPDCPTLRVECDNDDLTVTKIDSNCMEIE